MQQYNTLFKTLFIFIAFLAFSFKSSGQTIRFQQSIRGGFTIAANSLVSAPLGTTAGSGVPVNTAGGNTMSSYADLVLPPGSTIVKAYLYVEQFTPNAFTISSIKFRVPGGAYTTLNSASPGFIANPFSVEEAQFIIDVTSLMPANGYISTVTAGGDPTTNGRYAVADISTFDTGNYGAGWSLFVVYTNPASRYRNVSIADVCMTFGGTGCGTVATGPCSTTFNVNGISVPSSGIVNATVGFTGTYGDVGLNDYVQFGKAGTALTNLTDPTTNTNSDLYNSTVGVCATNNVSTDGGPAMSGNVTSRNPYNTFDDPDYTTPATWYSYFYDADIVNASGILPPSAAPINVTFTQNSNAGDLLGGGAYAIAVDIAAAVITKTISPTTIQTGGTATYTWTIDNTIAGALNLAGIGFTDNLPANLIVATPPGATLVGGAGGAITATAGSSSVNLSGLSLGIGQKAFLSVNVTNKAGQLNGSCAANPLAFTNGFTNITGNTANLANGITNQCLVVVTTLSVELVNFTTRLDKGSVTLNWATASEKNNARFDIERSTDGINFTAIGSVKGNANSTILRNYSFIDNAPIAGANYYRLKLVDYDGKTENSNILNVDITKFLSNIGINRPEGNIAEITFNANQECMLKTAVYDITGRKVIQLADRPLAEGPASVNVDLSSLGTGVYFVILSNSNGFQENIKIIK